MKTSKEMLSNSGAKISNFEPEDDLAIENWSNWALKRRTTDGISITNVAAISYGIDPAMIQTLSDDTVPSVHDFDRRVRYIVEAVDIGEIELLSKVLKTESASKYKLIRFSSFMDFAIRHQLALAPGLVELDLKEREKKKHVDLVTPEQFPSANVLEKKMSLKEVNLEITIGALLVFISKYAKDNKPIPKSLLRGHKLSYLALGEKLEEIIEGNDGAKRGHSAGKIRKTLSLAVKRIPMHTVNEFLSAQENESIEAVSETP